MKIITFELKSDVAQHAMTQYISENGWAEQVVSLKCGLTGDDNERCIIINYANDELRYEYRTEKNFPIKDFIDNLQSSKLSLYIKISNLVIACYNRPGISNYKYFKL